MINFFAKIWNKLRGKTAIEGFCEHKLASLNELAVGDVFAIHNGEFAGSLAVWMEKVGGNHYMFSLKSGDIICISDHVLTINFKMYQNNVDRNTSIRYYGRVVGHILDATIENYESRMRDSSNRRK